VMCVFRDRAHECEELMELEFSIASLLQEARPSTARGVEAESDRPGWFHLSTTGEPEIRFRLPLVEDQMAVAGRPQAERLLARRCIDAVKLNARTIARVERAMEAMAPAVSRSLSGSCPKCGQPVEVPLHVPQLVVDELRVFSAGVHEEVDVIASAYHWQESAILALPQQRRRAYAEAIQQRERANA
jgi:hypothetical protein